MSIETQVRCFIGRQSGFGDPQLRGTWGRVPFAFPAFEVGANVLECETGGNELECDTAGHLLDVEAGGNELDVEAGGNILEIET